MAGNGNPRDPSKFYSLFGGPESYYAYGPGQADYITVPGPNQTGPLINIPQLMNESGMPNATRGQIENIFNPRPPKDGKLPPKGRMTASADTGVQSDAMEVRSKDGKGKAQPVQRQSSGKQDAPAQPTPSTSGLKGDQVAPSTDPLAMIGHAIMSTLFGGQPAMAMRGGTTSIPKSPFVQEPTADDMMGSGADPFNDRINDASILDFLNPAPEMSVPPRNPRFQQAAPTMSPPMPARNPLMQDTGEPGYIDGRWDERSWGEILRQMYLEGYDPNSAPPNPKRNPLFQNGGV